MEWPTAFTFELIGKKNKAVDGDTTMSIGRSGHGPDPAIDVFTFGERLFLES
jgi:hypothetical protein